MLVKLYPDNPNPKRVYKIVEVLKKDGLIIYPTDTVYGMGCDIYNQKAVDKVARIKGLKLEKAHFSFICYDLSHISDFTKQLDNNVFKLIKKNLPGPFTFIVPANNNVPRIFRNKKKTVGIRVPSNPIILEIVRILGNPILSTSIHDDDAILDYITDPEVIHQQYGSVVDVVIDGGFGNNQPSTIVDCTEYEPVITRQGLGELKM